MEGSRVLSESGKGITEWFNWEGTDRGRKYKEVLGWEQEVQSAGGTHTADRQRDRLPDSRRDGQRYRQTDRQAGIGTDRQTSR